MCSYICRNNITTQLWTAHARCTLSSDPPKYFLVVILKKAVKSESNDGRFFRNFTILGFYAAIIDFFFFEWSKVLGNNCDVILFLTQYLNRFDLYLLWMLAHLWALSWVACSCIAVSFLRSVVMAWNVITERYNNQFQVRYECPKAQWLNGTTGIWKVHCLFLFLFFFSMFVFVLFFLDTRLKLNGPKALLRPSTPPPSVAFCISPL